MMTRTLLKELLERADFEAMAVESGELALVEFQKRPFDLALVDLMMPGMNGIELLEKLKALKPEVPVIILTAHNEIDSYLLAKEKGAFEYVVKPVDFIVLKQMLFSILFPAKGLGKYKNTGY
jgi:DNA-binding response OmpR family regulator